MEEIHTTTHRTAYFIMGPESSGTRMLTKAFCNLGIYGDSGHSQRMDNLNFSQTPASLVIRRSIPHGGGWPQIAGIVNKLSQAGYQSITPILILRNMGVVARSQVQRGHVKSESEARVNITRAVNLVYTELASVGKLPTVVVYEAFVNHITVRKAFFQSLGLREPVMEYYDANVKYML